MKIHGEDDGSFENYLKQFRPRAPEALATLRQGHKTRRALALGAWAAVILLTAALLAANWTAKRSSTSTPAWIASQARELHPLTIRSANELLARAPSLKAAMDELALTSEEKTVLTNQSAFEALSKENVNQ